MLSDKDPDVRALLRWARGMTAILNKPFPRMKAPKKRKAKKRG